ncbi:nuclear transport factor 2 family protein [Sinosporangium siamense]|uniref:SnoaL-like domain-containing protein n=1 Tax=Sinosporangium siamense TaxID=1367973 RepID=A0A919V8B4_9ACTN|nr:nuclear transport factor 2 family protein [Sinosporangium siamense]GII95970.1 hypothetical protein Ssi02_62010 [Sinosporangium siamense]
MSAVAGLIETPQPTAEALSSEDTAAVQRLLALFTHTFDNQQVDVFDRVFTEDAAIELRKTGRVVRGLAAIRELSLAIGAAGPDHHTLDTYLWADREGVVRGRSRYIAVLADGSTHNGDFLDTFARTPEGWRIRLRVSAPRFPLEEGLFH